MIPRRLSVQLQEAPRRLSGQLQDVPRRLSVQLQEVIVPPRLSSTEVGYTNQSFESSEWNDDYSYVYEPEKCAGLSNDESFPTELSFMPIGKDDLALRPTLEELMAGTHVKPVGKKEEDEEPSGASKAVKMGWIEGVLMRCLLNIWGVMLFLRLSWVVGQAGIIEGFFVVTVCNMITLVTALSMSAVATNGRIASGGVYYMISRALGAEFGGAIGLMFTLANSISVATYTLGFVDNLLDLIYDVTDFEGIVATRDDRLNDLRMIGAPVIVLLLILAIVGMKWVTRVQKLLLVLLLLAQVDMLVGTFLSGGSAYAGNDDRHAKGFTGWSIDTAEKNYKAQYLVNGNGFQESFMSVFGVFFTAVTGIVAGANLSGDLKDPSYSIPKGTLIAIAGTYVSYAGFAVVVGFNFLPEASGNIEEYLNNTGFLPQIFNCTPEANAVREAYGLNYTSCKFGSAYDQKVMTYMSATGYLVYLGCYGATLSSAIASLEGAPRVLQAVARDKIFPKLDFFAVGSGPSNAPLRGSVLVFCIGFGCLMIGELNTIGALASNFFLAAYALMNLSVFHSSMTKSPGWRPTFKFYNKWISLLGAFACVLLMFLMDWVLAIITCIIIIGLYSLLFYLKPEVSWGSSAESLKFLNALNNTYALNEVKDHIKSYRPKIILLTGNPAHRQSLVEFGNLLTKKLSLMICANIIPENQKQQIDVIKENSRTWFKNHNIKAFSAVVASDVYSEGVKNAVMISGLGRLAPNLVMMGYQNEKNDLTAINEYVNTITISLQANMSVCILRIPGGQDFSSIIATEETVIVPDSLMAEKNKKKKNKSVYYGKDGKCLAPHFVESIEQFKGRPKLGFVDVWWLYDDGGLTLLLPYILTTRRIYRNCKLRVFFLTDKPGEFDEDTKSFANLLAKFRIDVAAVYVIPDITKKANSETYMEFHHLISKYPAGSITKAELHANSERTNRCLRKAELLRERSYKSELIVLTLPVPMKEQFPPALYMTWLEMMTKGLPPVLLTRGNQTTVLTFYS